MIDDNFILWDDLKSLLNDNKLSIEAITLFQQRIYAFYDVHGRVFPWRDEISPYRIFISEIMLQQTQTYRVEPKFLEFIHRFPSFELLASANLHQVLEVWQGLGYNRRAKFLHQSAQIITTKYNGSLPHDPAAVDALPGIGAATASSIAAFAFNAPVAFIETNIRRVFIHVFFSDAELVDDKDLLPLIEKTLDHENARVWYWALMDYGAYLAKALPNPNRRSKHYAKQSVFEGSNRQLRGKILRLLIAHKHLDEASLAQLAPDDRLTAILAVLESEQLIKKSGKYYVIR